MREIGRAVLAAAATAAIGLGVAACGSSGAGVTASPASAGAGTSASSSAPGVDTAASGQPSGTLGSPAASASAAKSGPANYPVDLQPPTAAPGSRVMVYGLSCSDPTGTATSSAFTAPVALSMISNATGGGATVRPGLAAGSYPVTVTCGKITATGTLNVS